MWLKIALVAASVALFCAWAHSSRGLFTTEGRSLDLLFSFDICLAVVVSVHAQLHDLTLLGLPVLLLLNYVAEMRLPDWVRWRLGRLAVLFYFTPFYLLLAACHLQYLLVVPISLFALSVARELWRSASHEMPQPRLTLAAEHSIQT